MTPRPAHDARARDRALRRVRVASWTTGIAAAGLTAVLSAVAAHAFKGHDGKSAAATAAAATPREAPRRAVHVPPPDPVPALDGTPAPPQPPAQAPASVPPPAAAIPPPPPPPVTSGGS